MTEDDTDAATGEEVVDRLTRAMTLWENHMKQAAEAWHEGVSHSEEEYRRGLAEGLGVEPGDIPDETVRHWKESIMETTPEEFAASITDEGDDWLIGMYEGVTGEEPPERVREEARRIEQRAHERAGEDASEEEVATAMQEEIQNRAPDSTSGG